MEESLKLLADGLFRIGAIKFGEFKLKLHEKNPNAPLSPIYIDLRILRSFPDEMDLVVGAFIGKIGSQVGHLHYDLLADIPLSISPVVAIVSNKTRNPMVTPRTDVKDRGAKASILGSFAKGQTALVMDDLITKADSKLEAIEILEAGGLKVEDVLVLVDREQGGAEQLRDRGYTLHSVFKLSELLDYYLESGQIDQNMHDKVTEYIKNN